MEKSSTILLLLAFNYLALSQGYNEDYVHNKESDFLDYITSKRQEIEDALLRNRPARDMYRERDLGFFDPDHRDYNEEDLRNHYSYRHEEDEDDDEIRDDEEERERLRDIERAKKQRAEKIRQLKKESSDRNSPNHVIEDTRQHHAVANQKKKLKVKKNPKAKPKANKVKDGSESHKNEAIVKGKLDDIKNGRITDQSHVKEDKIETKKDSNGEESQLHINYEKKDSDAKFSAKEHPVTDDEKASNTKVVASKSVSSNESTPSQAPKTLPSPKAVSNKKNLKKLDKALFIMVVAACSVAGIAGLILASYCWYRLRNHADDTSEDEYKKKPEKVKEKKSETNDDKLVKGAEVYHYMHAKKQLAAMEKTGKQKKADIAESDSSDEESDNTVYECPGLAPPGDMKVINPLFSDAEKDHSDVKSDESHVSSPTGEFTPPQRNDQLEPPHE